MSFLDHIEPRSEPAGRTALAVPESYYPTVITVEDANVTEPRDDGGGGIPYAQLAGVVDFHQSPFHGAEIVARLHLSPGQLKTDTQTGAEFTSGYIHYLVHVAGVLAGTAPDDTVLAEYGYRDPARTPGEADRAYSAKVRLAFAQLFWSLAPDRRLDLMGRFLRVRKWNGARVIAHVGVREGSVARADGTYPRFNEWRGFYSLNDPKRGMEYVRTVALEQQRAMAEGGGLPF